MHGPRMKDKFVISPLICYVDVTVSQEEHICKVVARKICIKDSLICTLCESYKWMRWHGQVSERKSALVKTANLRELKILKLSQRILKYQFGKFQLIFSHIFSLQYIVTVSHSYSPQSSNDLFSHPHSQLGSS